MNVAVQYTTRPVFNVELSEGSSYVDLIHSPRVAQEVNGQAVKAQVRGQDMPNDAEIDPGYVVTLATVSNVKG